MISKKTFNQCLKNGLTIAFVESMTGGLLAFEMIKNPGSTKVTPGGIITYDIEQKIKLLHLDSDLFNQFSVVSKEVAEKMASAIRLLMKTDIGVSVTGNAGPKKQLGTDQFDAWIAIDFQGNIRSFHLEFNGLSRLQAIKKTAQFAYEKLEERF